MNIATVASGPVWKNTKANIDLTEAHVAKVMQLYPKTQIILFPEISLMGYVLDADNQDLAESIDGYCVGEIKKIAEKYKVALICGIIEENTDGKPFNTEFVISKDGELIAKYRKNHLYTESSEPEVYEAGEELTTFKLDGWKCGLSICFDIRFPRLFEAYKTSGVELIFAGFNWPKGRNKPEIMQSSVKARCTENQFFFAAVDRSGSDPNAQYYGSSIVSSPYAEDLSEKNGIYSYAEISKKDIEIISQTLPLKASFKGKYKIN